MERALALRDVMDHAVKVQREITNPGRRRRRNLRALSLGVLCALLLASSIYSWVARPEFIWGPRARAISPMRSEAEQRVAMFLLFQRLQSVRRAQGAYPASLSDIREEVGDIQYVARDTTFELRATRNGKDIVLHSTDNAERFLGNSVVLIGGRRQ